MITLLDFYADWCGPCQAMEPVFEKVMSEFKGKISLKRIDVDADYVKAQEYSIMSIPTMVLLRDGAELDRKIGILPEFAFRQWLKDHT